MTKKKTYVDECLKKVTATKALPWHEIDRNLVLQDLEELARRLKKACDSLRGIGYALQINYPVELADELEAPLQE